ncbi:MAG: fibronectin type III domain-containing protein [Bacteroidales bacterium]|nr:fibronectin type III domain-containing protein [Bacteroidales bacterium]
MKKLLFLLGLVSLLAFTIETQAQTELCSPISNLQVNYIYGTNATLSWNSPMVGTPDQYYLIVTDLSQSTSTSFTTTDTTYLLTGLSEQTPYQVGVYTYCTNGEISDTVSISFSTICNSLMSVTVADPNSSYSFEDMYPYLYTQQIISASDLGGDSASFTTMSLQFTSSSSGVRHWDIYAAQVSDSYLTTYILPSASVVYHHIFSGDVTINGSGTGPDQWFDFQLDSVLQYNGTDNLLLTIVSSNAGYSTITYVCRMDANMNNVMLADINMSNPYSYTNPSASSQGMMAVVPLAYNIRFSSCLQESCVRPNTLIASNVTSNSVDVSWVSVGSETSWELEYKASTDSGWTSVGALTSTQYSFSSLQPNTDYSIRVRALCSTTDISSWSDETSFHTECGAIMNLPYIQNFDGSDIYGSGTDAYVYCWDRYSSILGYPYYVSTSVAHSQLGMLRFNPGATAIMPKVDESINLNELQISYWVRRTISSDIVFELGVMTDESDPTTFEVMDTAALLDDWALAEYSFANYTGNGHYIAFRVTQGISASYISLDDIMLDYIPACLNPTNLHASNIGPHEVTLTWDATGSANGYGLYLISNNDTVYYAVYDTTITINNLLSATSYSAAVRSLCGNDSSVLSSTCSFISDCDAITITAGNPWFEDFASYYAGAGLQIQPLSVCWDRPVVDYNYQDVPFVDCNTWYPAHSGSTSVEFKGSSSMLALPEFTNDIHGLRLSFWATATATSIGNIEVGVITDLENPATFVPLANAGTPGPRNHIGNYMGPFDFDTISVANGRIALRYSSTNPSQSWNLDDFTVELIPDCPSPLKDSVTVSNIGGHSATVHFVDHDSTHTEWVVYYRASSDTVWTTMTTNTTTVDLTNLDAQTTYYVYVETACTPGLLADATFTVSFTTLVTCPAPTGLTVSNVSMTAATLSWQGAADSYIITCGTDTLTSTTNSIDLTGLTAGTTYIVTVQSDCGTEGTSSAATYTFTTALCDVADQCAYTLFVLGDDSWNFNSLAIQQNGITVATVTNVVPTSSTVTLNLCNNVSTSLVFTSVTYADEVGFILTAPDNTIVYAINDMSNYSTFTFIPDCSAFAPDTCAVPTALAVNNINQIDATATWVAGDAETTWNVEYKAASTTTWQSSTVSMPSFTMTNLTPNTAYQVRVQAVCDTNLTSDWTEAVTFTTAQEQQTCPAPTNLAYAIDETSHTTVTLTWQQEANTADEWQVNYRQTTESDWNTIATTATTYTLTDLVPNVDYEANVVAHCTNGLTSDPSNTVTWHTDDVGIQGYLERNINLYPNPATEMIAVEVSDANIMITGVEVYNVYGQLINTIVSTENPLRINISGLANGMYHVRVTTDGGVVTKSFVKR